jgi:hypothetical protein
MISAKLLAHPDQIRESFKAALPFKHVCLEDFLEADDAARLFAEFPAFSAEKAKNEIGEVGGKAVNTDLRNISPAYREFYDYLCSPRFLEPMSRMLGIPNLLFDPAMYGGGTHENLEGQELDPHIDFNYDPVRRLHRRVNLLIYLNKEWDLSWGGGIELHSDPRDWDRDQVKTFNCTFNRCVIFETNERSWHGFARIKLPADKRGLSRKCISIYLYTKDRPKNEIAPPHGTFYVQRPLPARMVSGYVLKPEDVDELRRLLIFRDGWIKYYQDVELRLGRERLVSINFLRRVKRRLVSIAKRWLS